jgi:glycine cleavage system transcriptional repressor
MANQDEHLVFTAVGRDRPGLVGEIAGLIHAAGANIEDSRMAILGGEFALIVLVSGNHEAVERVRVRARGLEQSLGLEISLKDTAMPTAPKHYLLYRLRVSGVDRPGIVSSISRLLAGRSINVASMESRVQYAPLSGTPLFVLQAELQIPSETAFSRLRKDLGVVCEEEKLDFQLETA